MKQILGMTPGRSSLLLTLALAAACSDDGTTTVGNVTESGTAGSTSTTGETTPTSTTNTPTTNTPTSEPTSTTNGTGDMSGTTSTTAGPTSDPSTSSTDTDGTGTTMGVTTQTTGGTTSGTTTDGTTSGTTTDGTTGAVCADGTIVCEGNNSKTCDGLGGFKDEVACPEMCVDGVGCVECLPGATQCNGIIAQVCNDQSMWEDSESCDALQGLMCDPNVGECAGACAQAKLGTSYIGCDYYPTTLANLHETQPWVFNYAVVVANTTETTANITVTRGANMVVQTTVGPGTAKVVNLPYVDALVKATINEAGPTTMVVDGAYRLRSTQPVTVYQYEPIEYKVGNSFSFTNDASLLLPVNTWTGNYIIASRNHWPFSGFQIPGFYAVVASKDNTKVTLKPSATGGAVFAGAGVAANGTGVVTLNEGDVLEVFTTSLGGVPDASDLTGTIISADKPVQAFGGHKCSQVPINTQACDRLEEAMPPIETLAKKYIITPPLIPTGGNVPKAQMIRVIATEDATALMYDPAIPGAPAMLAKAGDWAEIAKSAVDFEIVSDKKILVSQDMQGQQAGGNSGDPAMALAVATEQYRVKYLIHAPLSYESNYVNITAPMGAAITLDGVAVGGFVAIGATGFGVARVKLANNVDGNHDLLGDKAFGVSVYGYGQYTSYWYPGGLDLEPQPQ